jgi:hypothetical protein
MLGIVEIAERSPASAGLSARPHRRALACLGFRVGHPRFDVHRTSLQHAIASVKGEKCLRECVLAWLSD